MTWPPGMSKSPFTTQGHVLHLFACAMCSFLLCNFFSPGFSLSHNVPNYRNPRKALGAPHKSLDSLVRYSSHTSVTLRSQVKFYSSLWNLRGRHQEWP